MRDKLQLLVSSDASERPQSVKHSAFKKRAGCDSRGEAKACGESTSCLVHIPLHIPLLNEFSKKRKLTSRKCDREVFTNVSEEVSQILVLSLMPKMLRLLFKSSAEITVVGFSGASLVFGGFFSGQHA